MPLQIASHGCEQVSSRGGRIGFRDRARPEWQRPLRMGSVCSQWLQVVMVTGQGNEVALDSDRTRLPERSRSDQQAAEGLVDRRSIAAQRRDGVRKTRPRKAHRRYQLEPKRQECEAEGSGETEWGGGRARRGGSRSPRGAERMILVLGCPLWMLVPMERGIGRRWAGDRRGEGSVRRVDSGAQQQWRLPHPGTENEEDNQPSARSEHRAILSRPLWASQDGNENGRAATVFTKIT